MVVNISKNLSHRYSTHYIIKIVGFILIYYTINMEIISSCLVFSYCILDMSIYCKFESIILFFLKQKGNG